ncbi:MAG: hypothetical protein ACJA01_002199 [Saprospiraceae bacterium]|jgi:hypothetical protein
MQNFINYELLRGLKVNQNFSITESHPCEVINMIIGLPLLVDSISGDIIIIELLSV